jgi:hypothetical protein
MIDLNKIEAAAKSATPGAWWSGIDEHPDGHALAWVGNAFVDCEGGQKNYGEPINDAAHIATANPAAVLEMVSMIRERDAVLRQALEALECAKDGWMNSQAIAAIKGVLG